MKEKNQELYKKDLTRPEQLRGKNLKSPIKNKMLKEAQVTK